ncbi:MULTISPECIES: BLUF domain-containing protein [Giesbergeria]|uniref:BLUF domain-containing protein n=1 Tax=Giesbergeria sinuosa TaxID=80883 RepID=A0ABV9QFY2_9BURK
MLIQLTYASRCAHALGPADVKDILAASQRNNARLGVTGALCLNHGIFLQQLEGDRMVVNALYHQILRDPRHRDTVILDLSEITHRQFTGWSMGLLPSLDTNRQLFLKYSVGSEFDPYSMSTVSLRSFFSEVLQNVRWLE